LAASAAKGSVILTTASGDGMIGRDWYSNPNYYWVESGGTSVQAYHDGGNRWWYRGLVIINVASLAGTTLDPNSADFNFYSNGFSGVSLQYVSNIGSSLTTAYGQIAGTNIAALDGTTGWLSYDVTSLLQGSINAGAQNVGFVFNATTNYGGGSAASLESGNGAYLEVVPEPLTGSLLAFGGLAMSCMRRRSTRPRGDEQPPVQSAMN
jgi:hypothetical protein